jgi:hypothetical protein
MGWTGISACEIERTIMALRPANIDPSRFSTNSPQNHENNEEGWPEYIVRNVAKAPALTYAAARSGFGAGDVLKYLSNPEARRPEANVSRRIALPSFEEAREEPGYLGVPEYFYKERPGDTWAELVSSLLNPARQAGAFNSLGELGKYGARTAKTLGGAALGSAAGRAIGGLTGNETVEDVLGLAGSVAGGLYAGSGTKRPTQLLHQVEEEAFESNRAQRINALKEKNAPIISKREQELRDSILQYPKEKTAFEKAQRSQIKDVQNEIKSYHQKIKDLREQATPLYEEAKSLAEGVKGPADSLKEAIKQAKRDIKIGLTTGEQSDVNKNIKSVNNIIKKSRAKGSKAINTLLPEAKLLKQRFNNQIYPEQRKGTVNFAPGPTKNFKSAMAPLVQSLNEFINEAGGEAHAEKWQPAEEATRALKLLNEGRKDFEKVKLDEIKEIKSKSFPAERAAILKDDQRFFKQQLSDIEKTHNGELNVIAKETFDDYLRDKNSKHVIADVIKELKYYGVPSAGIGGMISAAGHLLGIGGGTSNALGTLAALGVGTARAFGKEISAANEVWARRPDLLREAGRLFTKESLKNIPLLVREVNALGYKMKQEERQEQGNGNKVLQPAQINPEDLEFA